MLCLLCPSHKRTRTIEAVVLRCTALTFRSAFVCKVAKMGK